MEGLGPAVLDEHLLAYEYATNLFRSSHDVVGRKVDSGKTVEIREATATVFKQHDRAPWPNSRLKQTDLMYDVLSCMHGAVSVPILGRENQEPQCEPRQACFRFPPVST